MAQGARTLVIHSVNNARRILRDRHVGATPEGFQPGEYEFGSVRGRWYRLKMRARRLRGVVLWAVGKRRLTGETQKSRKRGKDNSFQVETGWRRKGFEWNHPDRWAWIRPQHGPVGFSKRSLQLRCAKPAHSRAWTKLLWTAGCRRISHKPTAPAVFFFVHSACGDVGQNLFRGGNRLPDVIRSVSRRDE